eukprot:365797-Chlamydomonas_euryale.AAC.3
MLARSPASMFACLHARLLLCLHACMLACFSCSICVLPVCVPPRSPVFLLTSFSPATVSPTPPPECQQVPPDQSYVQLGEPGAPPNSLSLPPNACLPLNPPPSPPPQVLPDSGHAPLSEPGVRLLDLLRDNGFYVERLRFTSPVRRGSRPAPPGSPGPIEVPGTAETARSSEEWNATIRRWAGGSRVGGNMRGG